MSRAKWETKSKPPQDVVILGHWWGRFVLCQWRDGAWYDGNGDYHDGLDHNGGPDAWMFLPSPPNHQKSRRSP